jgi:hypothetical protein
MVTNQNRSGPPDGDEPVQSQDPIETPEHHVETAEEVYRSDAAAARGRFAPQRVYSLSAETAHEAVTRMARHPWATLAAGVLIGCLAGFLFRGRR